MSLISWFNFYLVTLNLRLQPFDLPNEGKEFFFSLFRLIEFGLFIRELPAQDGDSIRVVWLWSLVTTSRCCRSALLPDGAVAESFGRWTGVRCRRRCCGGSRHCFVRSVHNDRRRMG